MSDPLTPRSSPGERLLATPLKGGQALVDRLVLALALAPRPAASAESPLVPVSRRRRRAAPRRG